MAKCFIHGETVIGHDIGHGHIAKQACLKIYRKQDKKELSISFDNSVGIFGDELRRIEACIFPDASSNKPEQTIYVSDSSQLSEVITLFVCGIQLHGK